MNGARSGGHPTFDDAVELPLPGVRSARNCREFGESLDQAGRGGRNPAANRVAECIGRFSFCRNGRE
ncbi:MAG: hypothetical protein DWQ08_07925 [Proteobacteria bacterium]|nr:MAG: hypothetical protein DWQ08_07925 [Pseudomonadota bacterium]